jgi:DNA-binding PadR family transcriptional regulator
MELTIDEIAALDELAAAGTRGRTSSGLKSRAGLSRLVKAGYVLEESASLDTVVYVITDLGRAALASARPTHWLGVLKAKWRRARISNTPSTGWPTAKLVRKALGAISEFDKVMTVAKLRGARERKRREAGKCEGRKSHAERNPELVALAKRLHRQRPKGGRMSLRSISAELATQGFLNENGRPFAAASIKSMLHS